MERTISEHVVCYTDGSLFEGRADAGVFSHELGLQLGKVCTVFQAELFAIISRVQSALQQKLCGKIVYFCPDSQAALKALCSANSRSKIVIDCRLQIEELSTRKKIHSWNHDPGVMKS